MNFITTGAFFDRAKAIRFSTLTALCDVLDCQPGDLLAVVES
jgi:putative transcriptional regulator